MGKVIHKEMRRAIKQRKGVLVHAMGDGSTSLVAGVPEALMTTTMICTLTRDVIYFAEHRIELSIMVSGGF